METPDQELSRKMYEQEKLINSQRNMRSNSGQYPPDGERVILFGFVFKLVFALISLVGEGLWGIVKWLLTGGKK